MPRFIDYFEVHQKVYRCFRLDSLKTLAWVEDFVDCQDYFGCSLEWIK